MGGEEKRWHLVVPTDGDTLRRERLTHDLHDALHGTDGLTVEFAVEEVPVAAGHKGAGTGDVSLWVATVAVPGIPAMVALVRAWCARDRHRKVEITRGDTSLTLTGRPNAAQERIVRDFLDRTAGGAGPGGTEEA